MKKKILYFTFFLLLLVLFVNASCKKSANPPSQTPEPEEETQEPDVPREAKLTNLGMQIFESVIASGQFMTTDNGIEMVYSVVKGTPSRLVGFDANNGRLLVNIALANTETSWAITLSTDGWL